MKILPFIELQSIELLSKINSHCSKENLVNNNQLIDSGAYNTRKSVKKFVTDNDVKQIALTHYHEDHAGNAGFLKEHLNVPVYGHQLTIENLKTNVRLKPYEYYLFGRLEKAEITPLPRIIETNKYKFTPIHTPGHSQDHVIYHEKDEGWVFLEIYF